MSRSMTYQDAGVSIDAGNQLVNNIKDSVATTYTPGVLSAIGGFGGLFELPSGYKNPVLVSCTDGVGTKLALAIELNKHDTIGIDCVAMCVNDCVVSGAKPLWFLDYYATGKLALEQTQSVIQGIIQGCQQTGVALLGGETAEMPGMYRRGDYDVAGFCVGVVEKSKILDIEKIQPSDKLIAVPSSGVHSNGFSMVRKVLKDSQTSLNTPFEHQTLGERLLTPTSLYVHQTLSLTDKDLIKAAAHITGGGLLENIPRILPKHLQANVDLSRWKLPAIFQWLQGAGRINRDEMLKTFNCGIGMVYVVEDDKVSEALKCLEAQNEKPFILGDVSARKDSPIEFLGDLL